jgi:hypothetical protein
MTYANVHLVLLVRVHGCGMCVLLLLEMQGRVRECRVFANRRSALCLFFVPQASGKGPG